MATKKSDSQLDNLIEQRGSLLRLQPTYVRRFYPDGARLGLSKVPGGTLNTKTKLYTPERWIASTVEAANPHPLKGEGLSIIHGLDLPLRDALKSHGDLLLGPQRNRAHDGEFRALTKILDPWETIVFHFHAKDEHLRKFPANFVGHRFGKDEAYYFLEAPKGTSPYTHIGLRPGVTRKELVAAVERGRDYALELSPQYLQTFGEGAFTPSGVPHRPGSCLCLEIQQPSDVYTLLETHSGGRRMSPAQMHPGFASLDEAFKLIDLKLSQQDDIVERYRLIPQLTRKDRGGDEHWIFPPSVSRKFSGKRMRVTKTFESTETDCHALVVWRGAGTLDGAKVNAGDEFFVGHVATNKPLRITSTGSEPLELFKIFAAAL